MLLLRVIYKSLPLEVRAARRAKAEREDFTTWLLDRDWDPDVADMIDERELAGAVLFGHHDPRPTAQRIISDKWGHLARSLTWYERKV